MSETVTDSAVNLSTTESADAPETALAHGPTHQLQQNPSPPKSALVIDHVADFCKRYPGEPVTLHTRVTVHEPVQGFTVRIEIPSEFSVEGYEAVGRVQTPVYEVASDQSGVFLETPEGERVVVTESTRWLARRGLIERVKPIYYLVWSVDEPMEPGSHQDFVMSGMIEPIFTDMEVRSRAWVYSGTGATATEVDSATAEIAVQAKGSYLKHLPAIYEQDDFMGRFLMLFESFWRPLDLQIKSISHYFDPWLTPPHFLPWLAEWFHLELDENWSEVQQRRLLASILRLYRKRGTKSALKEYLEIYTNGPVEIIEHRARDFRLGPAARLGVGIALGQGNVPHTFTVRVWLPPIVPPHSVDAPDGSAEAAQEIEREIERQEQRRLRIIESIIELQRPAHTHYTLEIITEQTPEGSHK